MEISEAEEVQFLLSSRHLSLASPVFDAMLCGGWKESTVLDERPRKIPRLQNRDTSNSELQVRHEISATEWNTEALLLLMNIFHGHHKKVPHELSLDTFAHLALLVDYYKCQEITELFSRYWLGRYKPRLAKARGQILVLWVFVAWSFSHDALFEDTTELAVKESQGLLETLNLPLPQRILGMRPWHRYLYNEDES